MSWRITRRPGNLRALPDLIRHGKSNCDGDMANAHSREYSDSRTGGAPLVVAIVVAVLGMLGLLIVDLGPWNRPKVQPAALAHYSTTGEAARAAGAQIVATEPRLRVEPDPAGPKPVHPVDPVAR